jgi:AcrR family transcriptional regulator
MVTPDLRTDAPPRPQRADARRNKERIIEAARAVFAQHGIDAQIDEVAAKAKVGVGTVYRHFPTKDALLAALIATRFASFADMARESLEVEDPWEALAGYLRRSSEVMNADAGTRDTLARRADLLDMCPGEKAGLRELNEVVVARARDAGVVRQDAHGDDVPLIMRSVCSAMGEPELDWRRLLEIALAGLRASV